MGGTGIMTQILVGKHIKARYMQQTVSGTIQSSDIKPSGVILHKVKLDKLFHSPWLKNPKHHVLIDDTAILEIL
jgi:hypothetical protein